MGCVPSKSNFVKDNDNNLYEDLYWTSHEICCICLDRKSNILLLPCNHLNICDLCCRDSINCEFKKCPTCQQDIYSYNLLKIIPARPVNIN